MTPHAFRRIGELTPAPDRQASRTEAVTASSVPRVPATGRLLPTVIIALLVVTVGGSALAVPGTIILASTSDANVKGNGSSEYPALSADGTRVAFTSNATNLDPGDTDSTTDVYVKDKPTGDVLLASTSDAGVKGNGPSTTYSGNQTLSADGTRVVFASSATNLDPADTDGTADIYVKDLTTGDINLVSTSDAGVKGNGGSFQPSISGDGTKVGFFSKATNMDPADLDDYDDVYVKDLASGELTLASTSDAGVKGSFYSGLYPVALSADGTVVAFNSLSTNLDPADGDIYNNWLDVYVKDLQTGDIMLASTSDTGVVANGNNYEPTMSADGTRVGFHSAATNLDPAADSDSTLDVYVKNLITGDIVLASTSSDGVKGNSTSGSYGAALSANGTRIAFASIATNLHPGDTDSLGDIYVKTLATGNIHLASTSYSGVKANQPSGDSSLSASGSIVGFHSAARNLGPPDTDTALDVYVKEICVRTSRRLSIPCR